MEVHKRSSNHALRLNLKEYPTAIAYYGRLVTLRPLDLQRDIQALYSVSNGTAITMGKKTLPEYNCVELLWRFTPIGPFPTISDFEEYLSELLAVKTQITFCVFDASSDMQIGITMLRFPEIQHLKAELGGVWYSPIAHGSGAYLETAYFVLKYAFDIGFRRIYWTSITTNLRSCKAALKIGMKFEAIQQNYMILRGVSIDCAWFRILDSK